MKIGIARTRSPERKALAEDPELAVEPRGDQALIIQEVARGAEGVQAWRTAGRPPHPVAPGPGLSPIPAPPHPGCWRARGRCTPGASGDRGRRCLPCFGDRGNHCREHKNYEEESAHPLHAFTFLAMGLSSVRSVVGSTARSR
ncbi:MAG: hypothetical protein MZV70_30035 [Desulfobacterales bacterium]|nr:hypothetical protein [Desulfobacterales bacterium]